MITQSTDGVTWTEVTTTIPNSFIAVIVWGADKFVIGGSYSGSSGMAYSANGLTWAVVPNTSTALGSNHIIEQLGWGNGKFVAGTTNMAYSSDGITWNKAVNNPFATAIISNIVHYGYIFDFVWGNGKYVAVGYFGPSGNESGRIAYSTDANNWTTAGNSTFGTSRITAVAWGNGKFVAGGTGGKMAYSTDGVNWTAVTNSTFGVDNAIEDIAWGNNKFVAVGSQSRMAYSADGINWTVVADSSFR